MTGMVVDESELLNSLDNDTQFLKQLVAIFVADCPRLLQVIQAGIDARDHKQIANGSHALRGSISVFAANNAVESIRNLEAVAGQGKLEDVVAMFFAVKQEVASVVAALEKIVKDAG